MKWSQRVCYNRVWLYISLHIRGCFEKESTGLKDKCNKNNRHLSFIDIVSALYVFIDLWGYIQFLCKTCAKKHGEWFFYFPPCPPPFLPRSMCNCLEMIGNGIGEVVGDQFEEKYSSWKKDIWGNGWSTDDKSFIPSSSNMKWTGNC